MFLINGTNMNIHRYYEDEDFTRHHLLNPDLISFVREREWTMIEKIGEGSVSDVFTCRKDDMIAVIIFFGNYQCDNNDECKEIETVTTNTARRCYLDIHDSIEKARLFPNIFPIIYDEFRSYIPYSTDETYLKVSKHFERRTIQVIEKMDMSFDAYYPTLNDQQKQHVKIELRYVLCDYLKTLIKHGIMCFDLKADNIGVIINNNVPKFKLIDIESLWIDVNSLKMNNIESHINTFFECDEVFDV
jgi:hypothetical protein